MSNRDPSPFGVWDHGYDYALSVLHRDEFGDADTDACGHFAEGAEWGAGWAFALIGMAEAIRDNPRTPIEQWEYIGNDQWVLI